MSEQEHIPDNEKNLTQREREELHKQQQIERRMGKAWLVMWQTKEELNKLDSPLHVLSARGTRVAGLTEIKAREKALGDWIRINTKINRLEERMRDANIDPADKYDCEATRDLLKVQLDDFKTPILREYNDMLDSGMLPFFSQMVEFPSTHKGGGNGPSVRTIFGTDKRVKRNEPV